MHRKTTTLSLLLFAGLVSGCSFSFTSHGGSDVPRTKYAYGDPAPAPTQSTSPQKPITKRADPAPATKPADPQRKPAATQPQRTPPTREPTRTSPTRPTRTEPTRTEPTRTEPTRTRPTREPTRTEPTRTEPTRTEPTRTKTARPTPTSREAKVLVRPDIGGVQPTNRPTSNVISRPTSRSIR